MSDLLLQTKLFRPSLRPSLITRSPLVDRLNAGLDHARLTLISAPAGFGKTTLVTTWLNTLTAGQTNIGWLSLDENDNDPARFLSYLIAALQTAVPSIGETAVQLLQSPQPPAVESILTLLINDISQQDQPLILVLDDYHVVAETAVHQALTFLLEHLPPQLHLLITTRSDPALPLSKLRARGQMVEIRANDLRLTFDETQLFFNQVMDLPLSNEEMAALEQRTEGWIAGLQLAALSLKGRTDQAERIAAFTGSHRFIIDYLTEEVLNHQTEPVREFLLATSILERICGPLGDALTQSTAGQEILEYLEYSNLFLIPLDEERRWYRYHQLFAEVLQQRLQQTQATRLPELHRRAIAWFEQNGLEAEAAEQALRGRDWHSAARLIQDNMKRVQIRGEMATLLRWLSALPDEVIQAYPALGLAYAWQLVFRDNIAAAEKHLAVVEQTVRSSGSPLDASAQVALLGQVAAVRTVSALNLEYPGDVILKVGREALTQLPTDDLARRGFVTFTIGFAEYHVLGNVQDAERTLQDALRLNQAAGDSFSEMATLIHLSQMYLIQGRLHEADVPCATLLQKAAKPRWRKIPAAGFAQVTRGSILYEKNDLQTAQEALTEGIAAVEGYGLIRAVVIGNIHLARVKQALGDIRTARKLLDDAWTIIQKRHLKQLAIPAAAYRVRLLLQFGDKETTVQWAKQIALTTHSPLDPALEYDHMALARVQLVQGQIDEAQQLLARLLRPAEKAGRGGRVIEILILQAVATFAQQNKAKAIEVLEQALILAEPEGFVRLFVDEGEPLRLLLLAYRAQTEKRHHLLVYANHLLAAFPLPSGQPMPQLDPFLDPLSDRELEVLRLVADGASNRDIADELFLAVPTVKKHISNIMSKLNASSRTQAVAEARTLGLL